MSTPLRMLHSARHRLSPWRIVGAGTWLVVAFWSTVVVAVLAGVQDPTFVESLGGVDGLGDVVSLVAAAVSLSTVFLVVFAITLVVVPLRFVRELRRAVRNGRTDLVRAMSEDDTELDVLLGARPPRYTQSNENDRSD